MVFKARKQCHDFKEHNIGRILNLRQKSTGVKVVFKGGEGAQGMVRAPVRGIVDTIDPGERFNALFCHHHHPQTIVTTTANDFEALS